MDFLLDGFIQAFALLLSGNAETYSAIKTTLMVSSYSLGCSLVIGIPLGFGLGYFTFRGKKSIRIAHPPCVPIPLL